MGIFLTRHLQNAIAALGSLARQPVSTALTVAVIGIALALPAGLQVMVRSGLMFAGGWEDIRDFSVYLKPGIPLDQARKLNAEIEKRPGITDVTLIPAERALEEFRQDPAFGEVLKVLKGNPLPHTLVVRPGPGATPQMLTALERELAARPEVDLVQLDNQWLERLHAILDFLRRTVWLAAGLLIGAVVVIVGNTIRLDIQNRRQEIEVAKLLGATDAFVRRPFLYVGFWYGLMGGTLALLVLAAGLLLLKGPLERLLRLYGAGLDSFGLAPDTALLVIAAGLLAGWIGAWLAVARHLSAIQPRV
jgi:cell division transport system permease protein